MKMKQTNIGGKNQGLQREIDNMIKRNEDQLKHIQDLDKEKAGLQVYTMQKTIDQLNRTKH